LMYKYFKKIKKISMQNINLNKINLVKNIIVIFI